MRTKLENEEYILNYGIDHFEGLFIQVLGKKPERLILQITGTDKSTFLTVEKIVAIAETHDFDISSELEDPYEFDKSGSGCGGGCEVCVREGV